jgi:hypothetical protein
MSGHNLSLPSLQAALSAEQAIRSDRFEALAQLHRQQSILTKQIALAELLMGDSDREVARLRQQKKRFNNRKDT